MTRLNAGDKAIYQCQVYTRLEDAPLAADRPWHHTARCGQEVTVVAVLPKIPGTDRRLHWEFPDGQRMQFFEQALVPDYSKHTGCPSCQGGDHDGCSPEVHTVCFCAKRGHIQTREMLGVVVG